MHQLRRPKRRKIIQIPRNSEQLAQDNLIEISYLADQKFVDESQVLDAVIHHGQHESKQTKIHHDICQILRKKKDFQRSRGKQERNKTRSGWREGVKNRNQKQLTIANKLQSGSVFVGTPRRLKEGQSFLMISRMKKRAQTCPGQSFSYTAYSTHPAISNSTHQKLMIGYPSNPFKPKSVSQVQSWKIRRKTISEKKEIRKQMHTTLFCSKTPHIIIY